MLPPHKRPRLALDDVHVHGDDGDDDDSNSDNNVDHDNPYSADFSDSDTLSDSDAPSDDSHIRQLKPQSSKLTKKRKLRATNPAAFAATLKSLLTTQTASSHPLSLNTRLSRNAPLQNSHSTSARANERKLLEEKGRIRDVIGGWGVQSEQSLRKNAQQGGQYPSTSFLSLAL
jgi:hypothetical protein